ncbi:MAG: hypothetical protein ACLU38_03705 [Dysosmobacter sp.]
MAGAISEQRGPDPGPCSGAELPGEQSAIRQVLDPEPVLDKAGIDLALWMRGRYFCTVFEAVKTILPAGLWYGLREIWSLAMEPRPPARRRGHPRRVAGACGPAGKGRRQADIRALRDALGDGAGKALKAMKKAEILTCGDGRQAARSPISPTGWWNWPSTRRTPAL